MKDFLHISIEGHEIAFPVVRDGDILIGGLVIAPLFANVEEPGTWRGHLIEINVRVLEDSQETSFHDFVHVEFFTNLYSTLSGLTKVPFPTFDGAGTYNFDLGISWSAFGQDVGCHITVPRKDSNWWRPSDNPAAHRHQVFCRKTWEFWMMPEELAESTCQLEQFLRFLETLSGDGGE